MAVDGKQVTKIGDRLLLSNDSRLRHHRDIDRQPLATERQEGTVDHLIEQRHRLRLTQTLVGNLEDIRKRTDGEMSRSSMYFPFNRVPVNYPGKSNFKTRQFTPLQERSHTVSSFVRLKILSCGRRLSDFLIISMYKWLWVNVFFFCIDTVWMALQSHVFLYWRDNYIYCTYNSLVVYNTCRMF